MFLSPIFDSISKQGYAAAFTKEELADASRRGVIDERVIALGGVTPKHLGELARIGFGGGAFLGHVWNYAQGESFDSDLDTIFDGYIKPEH